MKKIEIYFGVGKSKDGLTLNPKFVELALADIRDRAARHFGGITLLRTTGDWFNQGKLISEPGAVFVVLTDSATHPAGVLPLVGHIKEALSQESVYVVTSNVEAELL